MSTSAPGRCSSSRKTARRRRLCSIRSCAWPATTARPSCGCISRRRSSGSPRIAGGRSRARSWRTAKMPAITTCRRSCGSPSNRSCAAIPRSPSNTPAAATSRCWRSSSRAAPSMPTTPSAVVAEIAKSPKSVAALLEGLRDGLQGRVDVTARPGWPALQARLKSTGGRTAQLAAEVAQQFGDTEAVRRNLATVRNERAAPQTTAARAAGARRPAPAATRRRAAGDARQRAASARRHPRCCGITTTSALGRLLIERYPGVLDGESAPKRCRRWRRVHATAAC